MKLQTLLKSLQNLGLLVDIVYCSDSMYAYLRSPHHQRHVSLWEATDGGVSVCTADRPAKRAVAWEVGEKPNQIPAEETRSKILEWMNIPSATPSEVSP